MFYTQNYKLTSGIGSLIFLGKDNDFDEPKFIAKFFTLGFASQEFV